MNSIPLKPLCAVLSLLTGLAFHANPAAAQTATPVETLEVNLKQSIGPLDHVWSKCAGSDRAAITLREQWRKDLVRFHEETGLERVRFHGIFADELGVFASSIMSSGKEPNWQNVDRVYDGLIERGVRPLVELSFMPKNLASGQNTFGFYKANITPPKDFAEWGNFIKAFTQHLVDRYGIDEVRQWSFEVWNEPNLMFFWTGKQADYFELYKATVTAVKSVDSKIAVGGPATSAIQWIPEFLEYCNANKLPLDFVATHIYVADKQQKIFGKDSAYAPSDVIGKGMEMVRSQIENSPFKGTPLYLTEWSSDSPAMIGHIIKSCLGSVQMMSHWTFSNTYEELGVAPFMLKEGDTGFGMMAVPGIPKPQFNTYKLLHRLGHTRLATSDGPVLASLREDGSAAIGVWNLVEVKQPSGIPGAASKRDVVGETKHLRIMLKGAKPGSSIKVSYVDQSRGSAMPEWRKMGSPQYPTLKQIDQLRKAAELAEPQTMKLDRDASITLELPPECFALIETKAK